MCKKSGNGNIGDQVAVASASSSGNLMARRVDNTVAGTLQAKMLSNNNTGDPKEAPRFNNNNNNAAISVNTKTSDRRDDTLILEKHQSAVPPVTAIAHVQAALGEANNNTGDFGKASSVINNNSAAINTNANTPANNNNNAAININAKPPGRHDGTLALEKYPSAV